MIQTADTLRYLYLGGRIGKAQNLLGSMLNIKPLIGIEDGEIAPLGRAHSRGQAYQQMAGMVAQAIGQGEDQGRLRSCRCSSRGGEDQGIGGVESERGGVRCLRNSRRPSRFIQDRARPGCVTFR